MVHFVWFFYFNCLFSVFALFKWFFRLPRINKELLLWFIIIKVFLIKKCVVFHSPNKNDFAVRFHTTISDNSFRNGNMAKIEEAINQQKNIGLTYRDTLNGTFSLQYAAIINVRFSLKVVVPCIFFTCSFILIKKAHKKWYKIFLRSISQMLVYY